MREINMNDFCAFINSFINSFCVSGSILSNASQFIKGVSFSFFYVMVRFVLYYSVQILYIWDTLVIARVSDMYQQFLICLATKDALFILKMIDLIYFGLN